MAQLPKPRASPDHEPSAGQTLRKPRLQSAGGGGRERGDRAAVHHPATRRELWLAIHLPQLVLESLGDKTNRGQSPFVVVDQEHGGKVVCACNAAAAADGVAAGMALNSALALQPGLTVQERDPRRERELLAALAEWAACYTPRISIEPPDTVLLEVRGSLRLFGGSRRLLAQLRTRLGTAALSPRLALTPTPLAALWFARAGEECAIGRIEEIAGRVAALPIACTNWPERHLRSLATMGVRTLGDCLRLPRDGFARRFEPGLLDLLDRALGRCPDPRSAFLPRERFKARRELEPELADVVQLGVAAAPLLAGLCTFLRQHQRGVQEFELRLGHRAAPTTRLRLRFAEPVADLTRITHLLDERLARIVLPEPVRALGIRSGALLELRTEPRELFTVDRRRAGSEVPQLIERLQARLGSDAVCGLRLVSEHRPEFAAEMAAVPIPEKGTVPISTAEMGTVPRPLWLLAQPQVLEGLEQPRLEGDLELENGPERIESGWWDGRDVARDYYVARSPAGARLWVFRERRPPERWFLHGVFG